MIIAVANQKGGVGKTTTTLNLGVFLAELGKKVLLVDMDPQANLTSGSGVALAEDDNTIYELLLGDVDKKDHTLAIKDVPGTKAKIIPASISLAGAEIELVSEISRESVLKNLLGNFAKEFDVILIDCPPSLGLITINSLVASQAVILPVQSEYYALEGLGQLLNTINLIKSKLNPRLDILGIVITMYDSRTNLAKEVAQELVNQFPKKVFRTVIPRNIKLSEAPSFSKPIHLYDPNSVGAKSYKLLAEEVISRLD